MYKCIMSTFSETTETPQLSRSEKGQYKNCFSGIQSDDPCNYTVTRQTNAIHFSYDQGHSLTFIINEVKWGEGLEACPLPQTISNQEALKLMLNFQHFS